MVTKIDSVSPQLNLDQHYLSVKSMEKKTVVLRKETAQSFKSQE